MESLLSMLISASSLLDVMPILKVSNLRRQVSAPMKEDKLKLMITGRPKLMEFMQLETLLRVKCSLTRQKKKESLLLKIS